MRIGLLGVGRIGRSHAKVLSEHPAVGTLVVADEDPDRAERIAESLECQSVGRISDFFVADLDAVMIATATDSHAELIEQAALRGLPTFCEKPVALSVTQTQRILETVNTAGIEAQIGFQRRYDRGYRAAREALRSGEIGDLHRIHLITGDEKPPDSQYIADSGGFFRDCSIHDFDIVQWVTGSNIVEVMAFGSNRGANFFREAGDVDNVAGILRLEDDTLVTFQGSRYNGGGHDVRMELAGTRSTYAVGLSSQSPLVSAEPDVTFPDGTPWSDFWTRFTSAYVAEVNAFIDVVAGKISSPCTVSDALAALYVAEAADYSLRQGRSVKIEEVIK